MTTGFLRNFIVDCGDGDGDGVGVSTSKCAVPPPGYRREGVVIKTLKALKPGKPVSITPTQRSWYLRQARRLNIPIATRIVRIRKAAKVDVYRTK
jgi:hypothetical protein